MVSLAGLWSGGEVLFATGRFNSNGHLLGARSLGLRVGVTEVRDNGNDGGSLWWDFNVRMHRGRDRQVGANCGGIGD